MSGILIILLILILWGINFQDFNKSYISLEGTYAIKGIFAIIILCSHMSSYYSMPETPVNQISRHFITFLGQTMVAPYLFLSGYGIWYSFEHKPHYRNGFFKNRFLKTLIHFDLALLFFILVQLFLPIYYPLINYCLCWIGWESVGNSNWFIFVILSLYLIAYLGLFAEEKTKHSLIPIVFFFSAVLWIALRFIAHKESWWVDTIAAFPAGMFLGTVKLSLESWLKHGPIVKWIALLFIICAAYLSWHHFHGVDVYGVSSCLFCLIIVIAAMKIRIGNPVLNWLGKNAFAIYILQRLPMIVLTHFGVNQNPVVFISSTILITMLLSLAFTSLTNRIDNVCFHA